jgi:DNA-binding HxlR family transcriptional regulator
MSSSVLKKRLDELVEAGVVTADGPGYQLSKLGEDLVTAVSPLEAWSKRWAKSLP